MKNINRILGVILTLAILAGSLVMAVPVSAGNNAWTELSTIPTVTSGTDANIYTIAADGTTIYMWTPTETNVSTAATASTTLTVQSTAGFAGSTSYPVTVSIPVMIGGVANTVTAVNDSKTLVVSAATAGIGAQVYATYPTTAPIGLLYKSTDAGWTWTADGLLPPYNPNTFKVVAVTGIKVCPTSTDNLIAWDSANLYRSLNGGKTWQMTAAADMVTGATAVYSADIIDNSGLEILVGTNAGVGHNIVNNGFWKDTNYPITTNTSMPQRLLGYSAKTAFVSTSTTSLVVASTAGFSKDGLVQVDTDSRTIVSIDNATAMTLSSALSAGHTTASAVTQSYTTATYTVAFAPNYSTTSEMLAVTVMKDAAGTPQTYLRNYVKNESNWEFTAMRALIQSTKSGGLDNIAAITSACLAFPSDFDFTSASTNRVFVGLATGGIGGDAYRVNGLLVGSSSSVPKVYDLGLDTDVYTAAYSGTANNGTLIVGEVGITTNNGVNTAVVMRSIDADTATSPSWDDSTKNPYGTGGYANVQLAKNGTLYAGTKGEFSAFSKANDTTTFSSFNAIGMIEVPDLYTVTFSGPSANMTATWPGSPAVKAMVFQKTSDSFNEMILQSALGFPSTSDTYYLGDSNTVPTFSGTTIVAPYKETGYNFIKRLIKSVDGGNTWSLISVPVPTDTTTATTALTILSADAYWIGYTGYIRSNTGSAIAVPNSLTPSLITFTNYPTDSKSILVKCTDGSYLYTTDGGAAWTTLGNTAQWPPASINYSKYVANGTEKAQWIIDSSNQFYKWILGTSTTWELTDLGSSAPAGMTAGMTLGSSMKFDIVGGVYFIVTPATASNLGQLWRNVEDNGQYWKAVTNSDFTNFRGTMGTGTISPSADGTYLYQYKLAGTSAPTNGMTWFKVMEYTDQAVAPPALTSPAANAEVNLPVDFSYTSKYSNDLAAYELQVARDADFTMGVLPSKTNLYLTQINPITLETGVKYYWRVRLAGTTSSTSGTTVTPSGLMSKWSDPRVLTVKTAGNSSTSVDNVDSVYPFRGQTGVSISPVITWGTVANATYNVQLASDSAFKTIVDQASSLTVAVWTPSKALDNSKVYYWKVQAVVNGINSDWVAFAFTTAAPVAPVSTVAPPAGGAGAAPPQTIVIPTPVINVPAATVNVNVPTPGSTQAPATPAYIWVIIVIGAVLVVAVVVLIVRTRRV